MWGVGLETAVWDWLGLVHIGSDLRNLMELRKTLHRTAYQHKTVKKLEQQRGKTAAVKIDPIAYPKLTDIFVESRLMDGEDDRLKDACAEYKARFLERKLMRMPQMWTLPTAEDTIAEYFADHAIQWVFWGASDLLENSQFKMPEEDSYLDKVLEVYNTDDVKRIEPQQPFRPVPREELRFTTAELNYGMGTSDPIIEIVFHDKQYQKKEAWFENRGDYDNDPEANPHRRKLFVFWNPPEKDLSDFATPSRLCDAAYTVAQQYNGKDSEMDVTPASPVKPKRTSGVLLVQRQPKIFPRTAFVSPSCENLDPDDDELVDELDEGTRLQVLELVDLSDENRLRAHIAEPDGWITLVNTSTGRCLVGQEGEGHAERITL
eukprot:s197_g23.t1